MIQLFCQREVVILLLIFSSLHPICTLNVGQLADIHTRCTFTESRTNMSSPHWFRYVSLALKWCLMFKHGYIEHIRHIMFCIHQRHMTKSHVEDIYIDNVGQHIRILGGYGFLTAPMSDQEETLHIIWYITVSHLFQIVITFHTIDLVYGTYEEECINEYVKVYTGRNNKIHTFCGKWPPFDVITNSNQVNITYVSKYIMKGAFYAWFQAADITGPHKLCAVNTDIIEDNSDNLIGSMHQLSTPNMSLVHTWLVVTHFGKIILYQLNGTDHNNTKLHDGPGSNALILSDLNGKSSTFQMFIIMRLYRNLTHSSVQLKFKGKYSRKDFSRACFPQSGIVILSNNETTILRTQGNIGNMNTYCFWSVYVPIPKYYTSNLYKPHLNFRVQSYYYEGFNSLSSNYMDCPVGGLRIRETVPGILQSRGYFCGMFTWERSKQHSVDGYTFTTHYNVAHVVYYLYPGYSSGNVSILVSVQRCELYMTSCHQSLPSLNSPFNIHTINYCAFSAKTPVRIPLQIDRKVEEHENIYTVIPSVGLRNETNCGMSLITKVMSLNITYSLRMPYNRLYGEACKPELYIIQPDKITILHQGDHSVLLSGIKKFRVNYISCGHFDESHLFVKINELTVCGNDLQKLDYGVGHMETPVTDIQNGCPKITMHLTKPTYHLKMGSLDEVSPSGNVFQWNLTFSTRALYREDHCDSIDISVYVVEGFVFTLKDLFVHVPYRGQSGTLIHRFMLTRFVKKVTIRTILPDSGWSMIVHASNIVENVTSCNLEVNINQRLFTRKPLPGRDNQLRTVFNYDPKLFRRKLDKRMKMKKDLISVFSYYFKSRYLFTFFTHLCFV